MDKDNQLTQITDSVVIEKILAGEKSLFEILVRRYNPKLYRIGRCYGFNHQDTEDLMQETHVTAYLNLTQLDQNNNYKAWVSTIMSHKCLYKKTYGYYGKEKLFNHLNGLPNQAACLSNTVADAEQDIYNRELAIILERTVQGLPNAYKTILKLKEMEGYSIKETAALTQITPNNVKVRLVRAKLMLQKKLRSIYAAQRFEFNLIYCDAMVKRVFEKIDCFDQHCAQQ